MSDTNQEKREQARQDAQRVLLEYLAQHPGAQVEALHEGARMDGDKAIIDLAELEGTQPGKEGLTVLGEGDQRWLVRPRARQDWRGTWVHRKGGRYQVIGFMTASEDLHEGQRMGVAIAGEIHEVQVEGSILAGQPAVIYRSLQDSRCWARSEEMFLDGRFTREA